MFKITGRSGRRNSGSGGVAQAARRIRGRTKFHSTAQPSPHVAFQDPPGTATHGFDSNSSRLHGLED